MFACGLAGLAYLLEQGFQVHLAWYEIGDGPFTLPYRPLSTSATSGRCCPSCTPGYTHYAAKFFGRAQYGGCRPHRERKTHGTMAAIASGGIDSCIDSLERTVSRLSDTLEMVVAVPDPGRWTLPSLK